MAISDHLSSGLVPPRRFGAVLERSRSEMGASLEEVAGRSHDLTVATLERAEAGELVLDDEVVSRLASAYDLGCGPIVPSRTELVIDLSNGLVSIGDEQQGMPRWRRGPDQLLIRYLGLVYALRDLPPGEEVPLRDADLRVLAEGLPWSEDEIVHRLTGLQRDPNRVVSARSASLKRRVAVPAAGLLVGLTAIGTLVFVNEGASVEPDSGPEPALIAAVDSGVELGPATAVVNSSPVELGPATAIVRADSDTSADPQVGSSTRLVRPAFE